MAQKFEQRYTARKMLMFGAPDSKKIADRAAERMLRIQLRFGQAAKLLTYLAMQASCYGERWRAKKMNQSIMAIDLAVTDRTIRNWLGELCEAGVVEIIENKRRTESGEIRQIEHTYIINNINEAIGWNEEEWSGITRTGRKSFSASGAKDTDRKSFSAFFTAFPQQNLKQASSSSSVGCSSSGPKDREAPPLASPSPREPSALEQDQGFDEDDDKIPIFLPVIQKMLSDIEGTKIDRSTPAQIYNDIITSAFTSPDVLYEYWSTQLLPNIKSESFMTKKSKSLGIGWCLQKALEIESGRYGGIDRRNDSVDDIPAIPVGSTVTCSDSSRVSYIGRHGVIVTHFGADCMVRWGEDEDSETRMKYKDLKVFDDILVEENIM